MPSALHRLQDRHSGRHRAAAPYVFREDGLADMDRTLKAVPALIDAGVTVVEFHPAWFGRSETDFDTILDGMTSIR